MQLIGDQERVIWKPLGFGNDVRHKTQFTFRLTLHGRLLTVNRLLAWGVTMDRKCVYCRTHEETRDHLLLHCQTTNRFWDGLVTWMRGFMRRYTN